MCTDTENENSDEKDLLLEPAAEEMVKGKFPTGASMPVTDLYRRKHKTDSKSVNLMGFFLPPHCHELPIILRYVFRLHQTDDGNKRLVAVMLN